MTGPISSTVPTGTEPLKVTSTTQVNNLNAAMVGGKLASDFVLKSGGSVTGALSLPTDGLSVGGTQLVATGGKIGIGGQPSNPATFQVFNTATTGQAALFQISNMTNPLPAIYGTTSGVGQAIYGLSTGTGRAGHFQIFSPGSSASALVAETNGSGYAGEFLGSVRATGPITSTVAPGTAPFTVASTTQVNNLNASMVGGKSAGDFVLKTKSDCSSCRYEDNGDGTVSDCRTGLIWLKDANCTDSSGGITKNTTPSVDLAAGPLSWADAVAWVGGLGNSTCGLIDGSIAGDWRLPTKTELMAMVTSARKQGFTAPALTNREGTARWVESDPFTHVQSSYYYWSGSTLAGFPTFAWVFGMNDGGFNYNFKAYSYYVWPVRSGQ